MSDEDWDLWLQYKEEQETIQAWHKEVFEHEFPHLDYVQPTDDELMHWMEEISAA